MSDVKSFTNSKGSRHSRLLITATLSAVCYGAWAYLINEAAQGRVLSTAVQFIGSFIAGYFVAGVVESVFARMSVPWRFPVAAIVPFWITLLIFAGVHSMVGTAEIAVTLLPNFSIGTLYFLAYCHKLEKSSDTFVSPWLWHAR